MGPQEILADAPVYEEQFAPILVHYRLTRRFMAYREPIDVSGVSHIFLREPPRAVRQRIWRIQVRSVKSWTTTRLFRQSCKILIILLTKFPEKLFMNRRDRFRVDLWLPVVR